MIASLIDQIGDIFEAVGDYIQTALSQFTSIFWDATANSGAGSLTFMGVTALLGLSFGVCLLIIGLIQRFLTFKA